ncbi:MAG: sulfur carrier protein ThiS [Holophagaceae bacterium]|nr:sulfur carrier protein ThiS [Holophagaceae bacterium]
MINVNGDPLEWHGGMTVQGILDIKKFKFPMLIVTVNEEHIPKERYATAFVPDMADVKVIHLLSGG